MSNCYSKVRVKCMEIIRNKPGILRSELYRMNIGHRNSINTYVSKLVYGGNVVRIWDDIMLSWRLYPKGKEPQLHERELPPDKSGWLPPTIPKDLVAQHMSEQERNVVGSTLKGPVYQGQLVNHENNVNVDIGFAMQGGTIHPPDKSGGILYPSTPRYKVYRKSLYSREKCISKDMHKEMFYMMFDEYYKILYIDLKILGMAAQAMMRW